MKTRSTTRRWFLAGFLIISQKQKINHPKAIIITVHDHQLVLSVCASENPFHLRKKRTKMLF